MNGRSLRVAMFSTVRLNPYVSLLASGIREAAPDIRLDLLTRLTLPWCLRERRQYDIIHIHWAELQYKSNSTLARWQRFGSFMAALMFANRCGMKLVYTVHNLSQHEGRHDRLNRWANHALFARADAVHLHNQSVTEAIRPLLGEKCKLFVIPHGSYVGYYPDQVAREEARERLGIRQDAFVYLSLGGLRPYKGIEDLIAAFSALDGEDLRLVIAGHAHEPAYARQVQAQTAGDPRIAAFLEHVPDEKVQIYMRAADVCVFPYRRVTTSGAAILALSFGLPIIAPAIGPFPALVEAAAGLTYDSEDPDGLRAALERGRTLDLEAARAHIDAYLDTISWANVGCRHAEMYRHICSRRE